MHRGSTVVHEDGGRPGPLLGVGQAVLTRGDADAAGIDLQATAALVVATAEGVASVNRQAGSLQHARVVDAVACELGELGVFELDQAARFVRRTLEDPPWILDQPCQRLVITKTQLGMPLTIQ